MDNKLKIIGLAYRARKVVTGEEFVVDAIRNKKIYYVFLASDAGVNTKKRVTDKAKYYQIPLDDSFTSAELSHAIGKVNRMAVGIKDKGFASILEKGCGDYGKKECKKEGRKDE